jgi:hypothetical protein
LHFHVTTELGVTNYLAVRVHVCGPGLENISITSVSLPLNYWRYTNNGGTNTQTADVSVMFYINHPACRIDRYYLKHIDPSTGSIVTYPGTDVTITNSGNLIVNTATPIPAKTFYIEAESGSGVKSNQKQVVVRVCGDELFAVASSTVPVYNYNLGTAMNIMYPATLISHFN